MTTEGLFFTALVIAAVALIGVVEKRRFDRVVRTFRALADEFEGEVTLTDFRKQSVEAVADVRGATVVARWAGRPGLSMTTLWAECADADGLDILVRPRTRPADSKVEGESLEVVTNDEDRARRWIGKSTKAAIKRAVGYRFRLAHGRVEATRAGPERDPEMLKAALEAVAAFASAEQASA